MKHEASEPLSQKDLQLRVAKQLYIHEFKQQSEIAKLLGVTQPAVSGWVKKYGWEKERDIQYNIVNHVLLIRQNMMRRMVEISSTDSYDLDEMNKAISDYNRFQERTNNKSAKLEAFAELVRYVQSEVEKPEQRILIITAIQEFIEHENK